MTFFLCPTPPALGRARAAHSPGLVALHALCALALPACPGDDDAPPLPPAAWQIVVEGVDEGLLGVHGTAADDVWAVGADKGRGPLVLHFDGRAWTRLDTSAFHGDLWWVHAAARDRVYFGGAGGAVLRYDGAALSREPTGGLAAQTVFGVWARSATDVWAVGATSGRNGFVWRYDGTAWRERALPADLPAQNAYGDVPGFFKVWGDATTTWIVGGRACLMRAGADGALSVVPTTGVETATLFTIAGRATGDAVVVGGAGNGALLEIDATGNVVDRTPSGVGLLQGVAVAPDGRAVATGARGDIFERAAPGAAWAQVDTRLSLPRIESLHAAWIDPDGGVWTVGGGVLSPALDHGVLLHRGAQVPRYRPSVLDDGGTPDAGPPLAVCPEASIDSTPTKSIARRWNEQILASIRRDIPRPGVHARNLYSLSAAMWDAWAAYDSVADGVFVRERHSASDPDAARREAISYAAFRVLTHRYDPSRAVGGAVSQACYRAFMDRLGYPPDDTVATGDSPRALGNRIGAAVIAAGAVDGSNEAMNYADTTGYVPTNPPLALEDPWPRVTDAAIFQELNLAQAATQNGIVLPAGTQGYIGANWGQVTPFAITRSGPDGLFGDPGPAPVLDAAMKGYVLDVIRRTAMIDIEDGVTMDISPGAYGNNSLGADDGAGHPINPVTGAPYAPNVVLRGDFARTLAEYWADGPKSETPPGHWDVIANGVADDPRFEERLFGAGPVLDDLAWDVHVYLALNGAVHDAAIAAWDIKRRYLASRPITLVRWMGSEGQSSDPSGPSYDPDGLPLEPGLVEVVTAESSAPGQRHAHLRRYVGQIAVRGWRGEPGDRVNEVGGVGWVRAVDWMPYQRRNFVTPAFPGFISGHSTFSRAAAEVLTALTGSAYFPGGLGEFVARRNAYLTFERGPSTEVRLQWATYYDAADQAGQSRIYGSIHIVPDDYGGRRVGHTVGLAAVARARAHFDGTAAP
jgi:photosystem II stability/assembly factor-like uncharacterized protein